MSKIGVVGAGTMGQGIAQAFAQAGNQVTVCDIKIEWAQGGIDKIGAKLDKLVSRGKVEEAAANEVKGNLKAGEYADLADADYIVEAVLEKVEVKQELFKTLDEICKDSTIFCTNTSSLSVTEIANGVKAVKEEKGDDFAESDYYSYNKKKDEDKVKIGTRLGVMSEKDAETESSTAK